jgi:hypothetical protein
MGLAVIAAIYIGFSVADGRPKVIAVETAVATAFLVIAAAGVTGTAWLLVAGFAGHGAKDLWQCRNPVRCKYQMVATILRRRRRGRGRRPRRHHRDWGRLVVRAALSSHTRPWWRLAVRTSTTAPQSAAALQRSTVAGATVMSLWPARRA